MPDEVVLGSITQFVETTIQGMERNSLFSRNPSRRDLDFALREAIQFGKSLQKPEYPPYAERIQGMQQEITRLEAMVTLSKSIMEEKDQQIRLYKDATGDLPLYVVRERINDTALKNAQDTINRLSTRLMELSEGRDGRIDHLEGLLQRQRDRIAALEASPENEEGRFNIERQYEREMTNVSHLTGKIFNLECDVKSLTWKVRTLESQLEIAKAQRDSIQRMHDDYKKRNPDHEELLRQAAEKIANQPWRGHTSVTSETLNTATNNYLKQPGKLDY